MKCVHAHTYIHTAHTRHSEPATNATESSHWRRSIWIWIDAGPEWVERYQRDNLQNVTTLFMDLCGVLHIYVASRMNPIGQNTNHLGSVKWPREKIKTDFLWAHHPVLCAGKHKQKIKSVPSTRLYGQTSSTIRWPSRAVAKMCNMHMEQFVYFVKWNWVQWGRNPVRSCCQSITMRWLLCVWCVQCAHCTHLTRYTVHCPAHSVNQCECECNQSVMRDKEEGLSLSDGWQLYSNVKFNFFFD